MQKRIPPACISLGLSLLAFAGTHSAFAQNAPAAPAPQTPPVAAPTVKESPEDTAKKELQAIYDLVDKSLQGDTPDLGDNALSGKHLAPDIVGISPEGKERPQPLSALKAALRASHEKMTNYYGRTTIETITVQGNTATVEVTSTDNFTLRAQNGARVGIRLVHHDRDFWVKKNGDWLLKRTRVLDTQSEANGKPINVEVR